jgi:archaellum component FlaC
MEVHVANFGTAYTGSSTVGYTIYDKDRNVLQARTTTGVGEIVAGSGIYTCKFVTPAEAFIIWDNGVTPKKYAADELWGTDNNIYSMEANIRMILNSMRNQGEAFNAVLDKLGLIEKNGRDETMMQKLGELDISLNGRIASLASTSSDQLIKIRDMVINKSLKDAGKVTESIDTAVVKVEDVAKEYQSAIEVLRRDSKYVMDTLASVEAQIKDDVGTVKGDVGQAKVDIGKSREQIDRLAAIVENVVRTVEDMSASIRTMVEENTKTSTNANKRMSAIEAIAMKAKGNLDTLKYETRVRAALREVRNGKIKLPSAYK